MTRINIMTWNVDWFRKGKRSGKEYEYFETDCDINIYKGIIHTVSAFLTRDNSIVFLQEVPNKILYRGRWHTCELFKMLINEFPTKDYDIFYNKQCSKRYTLALCRKGMFMEIQNYFPQNNRTVAVSYGSIIIMGVHMPTRFRMDDDSDRMWKQLIDYVDGLNQERKKL